jgi:hypothetical protein
MAVRRASCPARFRIPHLDPVEIEANVAPYPIALDRELAELRRAMAPYPNLEWATAEGRYDTQLTPCWYHTGLGGMGYDYGNLGLQGFFPERCRGSVPSPRLALAE